MTLFVLFNWIFCLSTSLLLAIILIRYRFLLIKPSIIIIAFFHLRIQWAATFQAGYIENYLIHPFYFLILVQIFPLGALIGTFFIFHKQTTMIYSRIANKSLSSFSLEKEIVYIILTIILIISIYYLWHVPLSKTGLYTILVDPSKAAYAREASLKLVENPLVRYSYSFLKNVFAPLLSVLLVVFFFKNIKIHLSRSLVAFAVLISIFPLVSLTGARSPAAALILTIIWAFYLKSGMPLRPFYLFLAFLLIVTPPVILTILREGQVITPSILLDYFLGGGLFDRIFVLPMKVGLYHVYHAQTKGFFGIAAVPKIAVLLGVQPIIVANFIYLNYLRFSYTLHSGLANTSYVFSYYSYFGILSVIFSVLALWALDFAVLVFKNIKNDWLLLACIASLFPASLAFIATDYTIALFTGGYFLLLFVTWVLDKTNTLLINTRMRENNI